jgi:alanine racemase
VPASQAETALRFDLTLTVNELDVAQALSEAAQRLGRRARVHIKIDTGMTRFGLLPDEAPEMVARLARLPGLELEGLCTHFAMADEPDNPYTLRQLERFLTTERTLARRGLHFRLRHAANSAAILDFPEAHFDAVRAGIALYGIQPGPANRRLDGLRPALTLKAEVARVRQVPPGTAVSYGCTYRTSRTQRLALLPVGYGDGLSRALSNRGAALLHGRRAPIVGRVCMDMCIVDATGLPDVHVGDEAVLIGTQAGECIPVEELAALADTLHYEVLTGISARVPRLYFQGGRLVAMQTLNGRAEDVGENA